MKENMQENERREKKWPNGRKNEGEMLQEVRLVERNERKNQLRRTSE